MSHITLTGTLFNLITVHINHIVLNCNLFYLYMTQRRRFFLAKVTF